MSVIKKVKVDVEAVKPEEDKVAQHLTALDKIHQQIEEINARLGDEILQVEAKYNKEKKPFYKQRSEHASKIPNFWLTVLDNANEFASVLTDDDKEVLKHLIDIDVVDNDDIKTGFKIHFKFEKNNFFDNEILTREYKISEHADNYNIISNKIKWKPGKDLTAHHKVEDKGPKRTHIETENIGFFSWFNATDDDDIGVNIKEMIFPNAFQYYSGIEPEDLEDEDDDIAGGDDEAEEVDDEK